MTACTDRVAGSGDDTTGQATSTGETGTSSTSSTVPTTGEPTTTTSEPDTTSGTTTPVDLTATTIGTTEPDTTTGTTEPDTTTGTTTGETDTETEFPAPACPSACERTTVHMGDLMLAPGDSTAELVCITEVTGNLVISGEIDEAALAGLSGLEKAGGLLIFGNAALTGLAPFSCLREVDTLQLINTPTVVDLTPLAGLTALRDFALFGTGVTALPELTAPQLGLEQLELNDNPALQDLDALTTWTASSEGLSVTLFDMPALTSVAGLAGPLTDAADGFPNVHIEGAPQLGSLAGLEPLVVAGFVSLLDLPKVADLGPLAQIEQLFAINLSGMPLVTSLSDLGQLKVAQWLVLGGCINGGPEAGGMNGLTSLAGLAGLTQLDTLGIANSSKLSALTGMPALKGELQFLHLVNNPLLDQQDVNALVMQLGQAPGNTCLGTWNQCECIFIEQP